MRRICSRGRLPIARLSHSRVRRISTLKRAHSEGSSRSGLTTSCCSLIHRRESGSARCARQKQANWNRNRTRRSGRTPVWDITRGRRPGHEPQSCVAQQPEHDGIPQLFDGAAIAVRVQPSPFLRARQVWSSRFDPHVMSTDCRLPASGARSHRSA
jgi:hypothetical protein